MRTEPVELSVKEIGYFASRLLVAAQCPPGAAPEIARVAFAQDLLVGGALEELIDVVDSHAERLLDLTVDRVGDDEYRPGNPSLPSFALLPFVMDVVVAESHRLGRAHARVRSPGAGSSWLEGLLSTRHAPGMVLAAAQGPTIVIAFDGSVYRSEAVEKILGDLGVEASPHSSGSVTLAALECDAAPLLLRERAVDRLADMDVRRSEAYDRGRPIAPAVWERLRRVVSRTLVASSEKSRMGAG